MLKSHKKQTFSFFIQCLSQLSITPKKYLSAMQTRHLTILALDSSS